ncbi:MAG TPA: DUF882 domain-containing protein [Arenibaculum sp.]|nr:DUF882 domain-containing protein [Arenibaculum sp.]
MTDGRTCGGERIAMKRRGFLRLGTGALAAAALFDPVGVLAAGRVTPVRKLSLLNLHTSERLTAEYWVKGHYQADVLAEIERILRDHRTGERHAIDRGLLDLVYVLHNRLERTDPFHIVSGYRSPATNAMLRSRSGGVATNSYHMRGMAIDLCLPGASTRQIYRAALRMRCGGVGHYPDNGFVHVDVGPVRTW